MAEKTHYLIIFYNLSEWLLCLCIYILYTIHIYIHAKCNIEYERKMSHEAQIRGKNRGRSITEQHEDRKGPLVDLFIGGSISRLLDFFLTFKEFDYNESDIRRGTNVSPRQLYRILPKGLLPTCELIKA